jgi:5,10-methylene-tetrahydrofolate dehydrogenase/methenyl tetrahydrofolate cyclohydrolase
MISVSGILVQLPLPKTYDKQKVIETIRPSKMLMDFIQ